MPKVAVVIFADIEGHADTARAVNALETVKEFKEAGDEARLIFDGAGTRWIGEFARPDLFSHRLYESVKDRIAGACAFCAEAFRAKDAIQAEGIPLLDEIERHPSLRKQVSEGFEVITF